MHSLRRQHALFYAGDFVQVVILRSLCVIPGSALYHAVGIQQVQTTIVDEYAHLCAKGCRATDGRLSISVDP